MSSGVGSYMLATRKSAYHENCVPADRRQQGTQTETTRKESEFTKCDAVTQDKIWKQSVGKEGMCLKNWEDNWGFLTDFDAKSSRASSVNRTHTETEIKLRPVPGIMRAGTFTGNVKERTELPENTTVFSDSIPNTNSGNYGHRVTTEVGMTMQSLEKQFFGGQRKRKLGNDLVCY